MPQELPGHISCPEKHINSQCESAEHESGLNLEDLSVVDWENWRYIVWGLCIDFIDNYEAYALSYDQMTMSTIKVDLLNSTKCQSAWFGAKFEEL